MIDIEFTPLDKVTVTLGNIYLGVNVHVGHKKVVVRRDMFHARRM